MGSGNDSRVAPSHDRRQDARSEREGREAPRSSRSSVRMTEERAHGIQARTNRTDTNLDFKARGMSAADPGDATE